MDQNDGQILLDSAAYPGNTFVDTQVVPGTYHYYGIYLLSLQVSNLPGWTFTTTGTPLTNSYFIVTTAQSASISPGQEFTDSVNLGTTFTVQSLSAPSGGFVNVNFTPPAPLPMNSPDVVTQVQVGAYEWVRAGLAATLAPFNYGSGNYLFNLLPAQVREIDLLPDITSDAMSNSFISQFMNVIGWGLDYLKTQYAVAAQANNPNVIPIDWLADLAATVGYPFTPEIPAGITRKGIANSATAYKLRGTLQGIEDEIDNAAGFNAEVSVGYNQLLENDQAYFQDPSYPAWSQYQVYHLNERVTFGSYVYQCLVAGTTGIAQEPTGTTSTNTWWEALFDFDEDTGALFTPNSGPLNQNWNFDGGISPWTAGNNATVTASTAWQYPGNTYGSLLLTGNGTTANPNAASENTIPVSPSTPYPVAAVLYSPQGWSTTALLVNWYNSAGTFISSSSTTVNLSAGVFQFVSFGPTSPGTAKTAQLLVQLTGTPATTVQLFAGIAYILGPQGGSASTWIARYPGATNAMALPFALREGIGVADPFNPGNFQHGSVRVYNKGGSPQTVELKTLGHTAADIAAGAASPDPALVIADAIPMPFMDTDNDSDDIWNPTTQFEIDQTVNYQGQPFLALRASTGAVPPANTSIPTNEWQPLGSDIRLPLLVSAWTSQSIPTQANFQCVVTPYAIWYDQWGRQIARVNARSPYTMVANVNVATTAALPANTATSTTLTANSNAAFPAVDGVTLNTIGQTILVQNEATQANNGLYSLTTVGSGSAAWVLTRTATPNTAYVGLFVQASFGTVNGGVIFYCQNTTTPTFGTTAITFATTGPFPFQPPGLYFDSFSSNWGSNVTTARLPDIGGTAWGLGSSPGNLAVTGFGGGTAAPAVVNTRSYAFINSTVANCQVGVTLISAANNAYSQGIVFRFSNDTNYWRADQFGLAKNVAGALQYVGFYPQVCLPGDRLVVVMNGSSITVKRNNVTVLTVTDAFNSTATGHGIIYELSSNTNYPTFTRGARPTRGYQAKLFRSMKRATFIIPPPVPVPPAPSQFIDMAGPRPIRFDARLLTAAKGRRWFDPGFGQSSQGTPFPTGPKQRKRPVAPKTRRR